MLRSIVVTVVLLLLLAGRWFGFWPRSTPAGQAALTEVPDIDAFKRWFNDSGPSVRVVALLSPT